MIEFWTRHLVLITVLVSILIVVSSSAVVLLVIRSGLGLDRDFEHKLARIRHSEEDRIRAQGSDPP